MIRAIELLATLAIFAALVTSGLYLTAAVAPKLIAIALGVTLSCVVDSERHP